MRALIRNLTSRARINGCPDTQLTLTARMNARPDTNRTYHGLLEVLDENSYGVPEVSYQDASGICAHYASGGRDCAQERSERGDGSGLGHAHHGGGVCKRQRERGD